MKGVFLILKKSKVAFAAIGVIFFVLIFISFVQILNHNKISRGVSVAGISVGGLTKEEAIALLNQKAEDYGKIPVRFEYADKKFEVKTGDLGVSFSSWATVGNVYAIGRDKNFFFSFFEQMKALSGFYDAAFEYRLGNEKFRQFLTTVSSIESPAKDAALVFDSKTQDFFTTEEKNGLIVDRRKLRSDLDFNLSGLKQNAIIIFLISDKARVGKNETLPAKDLANEILNRAPYVLKFEDREWSTDKETVLSWLKFEPVPESQSGNFILGVDFDAESIEHYIIPLAPVIDREPVNAQFEFKNNKVGTFALGQNGRRLNIEKSRDEIIENLKNGRKTVLLAVKIIEPEITAQKAGELGIKEFLGKGVSDFVGSPKNRRENIRIGAAKFHGVLIRPGDEFSFNKILGEVGPKQGYLPELVIKKNKTVPEYGGGLCQVSTTIFRAAVNAGLLITDRYPHSFPVKYYNPQGFDATVYPPSVDFKFKNDTPDNILIQTKTQGTKLTFEFYGTSDGREVKVTGPEEYDKKADGSLRAKFVQEIYQNGELSRKMTFRSIYKSPSLYPVQKNPLE